MKNRIVAIVLTIMIAASPVSSLNAQSSSSTAAGGMSVGTAVAIGVVGAALLVALGDSSSSAPSAVTAATSGASTSGSTTPITPVTTTTTTTTD
tara:strand:+ start:62 stop:343 length:282 start_codon:yes stop_codon:yes gene_type:complete